jgi:hypothetical protein
MCLSLTAQADSGHISIDERRAQGYFTLFSWISYASTFGTPRLHTVVVMVSFRLQVCRMFRNECEYSGSMLAGRNTRCSGNGRYSAIQNESSLIVQFVSYFEQNRRGVQSWWSSCRARLSPWNIDLTISISLITKYLYH